jgi:Tfp pilus assembly protein PilF/mono/diheme cytochrome c family protein
MASSTGTGVKSSRFAFRVAIAGGLLGAAGVVCATLSASPAPAVPEGPTFAHDIAPILLRHCVTCHHPGTNGAFSLLTYDDVRPRAKLIAAVTQSRYMPPWKPEPGFADAFIGQRGLSDVEIAAIQRWTANGALLGDRAELPASPTWSDGWRLGTPDLVIRMPEAFDVPANGADIFRNFVIPIPNAVARYVKAMEFMPGTRAVHHANMRFDETRASRLLDEKDPAPGYDGLTAASAHYPEGYFFGWTPGQLPPASEDLAWRLNPDTDMVLQLHLKPTGQPERVRASIGFYFAPGPPRTTPAMLRLGKQNIDIAPGQSDYVVTDSYVLPVEVDVHAVQPHAHNRAKEIKGFATLPGGSTKWLIYIRSWDFDWQDTYRYVKPFRLPKGTTLTMQYTYDNSVANRRNPQLPPQRVRWGQNSLDEMGDLWIQVVPRSRADLNTLVGEFRQKVFREDILGYEMELQRNPDDVSLHDDIATLYMAVGRTGEAIAQFSESVRLTPEAAAGYFNLGTALAAAGRIDESIAQFGRALQLQPDYALALNNLGSVLVAKGQTEEAVAQYRRALGISPGNIDALNNIGNALSRLNRLDEALDYLRRALAIDPEYADAHYNMAHALAAQGHEAEAVAHYRAALMLRPDWPQVRAELTALLANHPELAAGRVP